MGLWHLAGKDERRFACSVYKVRRAAWTCDSADDKSLERRFEHLQSSLVLPSIVEEIADNKEEDSVTPTSQGGSDSQLLPDDTMLSDLLGGNSQAGGASGSAPSGVQRQTSTASGEMVDDSEVVERPAKVPRMGVNQVLEAWDDDEHWEDAMEDEGYEPMELCEEEGEPEGPPKLSEAELAEVEKKAGKDEIVKLMERRNVIRPATDEEVRARHVTLLRQPQRQCLFGLF